MEKLANPEYITEQNTQKYTVYSYWQCPEAQHPM